MKPWIVYTLARLAIFAVLVAILAPLFGGILPSPAGEIAATAVAAIMAFCISYLALGRLRAKVTTSIVRSRDQPHSRSADEVAEDDAVADNALKNDAVEGGTDRYIGE